MLAQQTANANAIGNTAGTRSQQIYDAGRGDVDFARTGFRGLYDELMAGGGDGGGGYSYSPAAFESEALPFYLQLMREGGYDERTRGAMESSATAPISGMFQALKRNLETARAGRGLGYGGGSSALAKDQAYSASEANKRAFGDIQKMVLESKLAGAGGVTGIESEKRAFEAAERARAAAAASAGGARAGEIEDRKRRLLYDILGLEGDRDLAYMDRQLGAGGLGLNTINSRVDETPLWQKSLAAVAPAAASSAVGAFMPVPKVKKQQQPIDTLGILDNTIW